MVQEVRLIYFIKIRYINLYKLIYNDDNNIFVGQGVTEKAIYTEYKNGKYIENNFIKKLKKITNVIKYNKNKTVKRKQEKLCLIK